MYFTWEKCIKCAYGVCSCIAQNLRWITVVLSNDITAILPCTAHYLQPECSRTLHFQYTRVSKSFFNTTLYCKQVYLTWEKCIQCAYRVLLHCTKCALNYGCLIQRYRNDPAMYSTTRNQNLAIHSIFNKQEFQADFLTMILFYQQVYFTWEKCIHCAYGEFLNCIEFALNHGCFIQRYRNDPAMYSTLRATKM